MKRKTFLVLISLVLTGALAFGVFAESYTGKNNWAVEYNGTDLSANFKTGELAEAVCEILPGDSITLTVSLKNSGDKDTDWWMSNTVVNSFEDSASSAAGGAYEYELTYTGASGADTTLYSSNAVGGDDTTYGEGLHEATDALDDFFFLETLSKGQQAKITLTIALDGETQGNSYQKTLADLEMSFAVEEKADAPTTNYIIVRTGDMTNMTPYYTLALVSGIGLLAVTAVYAFGTKRRVKGKR